MKPFLVYRLPGSAVFERMDFDGADSHALRFGSAVVNPWPGIAIGPECGMSVASESTPRDFYTDSLRKLIPELEARRGKTVIVRQICGSFFKLDVEAMAREYFSLFPAMFCFLFFHPYTGFWMGASPELLLEMKTGNVAATRALAGTRLAETSFPWSDKNIEEHRIVVDEMLRRAHTVGVDAAPGETGTLGYGNIEHLCTPIALSSSGPIDVPALVGALHPTAAVCGYPREKSMQEIEKYEGAPRNCYGGLVAVDTPSGRLVYVILRCVHFDMQNWAVYTGSGITPDSDPDDEWLETEAKAQPLLNILQRY